MLGTAVTETFNDIWYILKFQYNNYGYQQPIVEPPFTWLQHNQHIFMYCPTATYLT